MTDDTHTLIILDDQRFGRALIFERPVEIICCRDAGRVETALQRLTAGLSAGLHAAGFMAYELGYALEPRLEPLMPPELTVPLLWFGLFDAPRLLGGRALTAFLHGQMSGGHRICDVRPGWDRKTYIRRFECVQDYIAAGDVYQVNLTFPLSFRLQGDPVSLWCALRARQPVAHGGFIRAEDFSLLSLSPELFVTSRNGVLTSRPMKGTSARRPDADDRAAAESLYQDPKTRAENLMIVDLIRNDISRVTRPGSVRVPDLYTVETYPSFFGMTSTVTGHLSDGVSVAGIIKALFPCGSVTGAPKIRAQQIIRKLEDVPRGVYTGSMGRDGAGMMGIGSGLVRDSDCEAEYEECLLKAAFLMGAAEPFRLIETLLWTPEEGYNLLTEHMERLTASAAHFGFRCDEEGVRRVLNEGVSGLEAGSHRVRLLLDAQGGMEVTSVPVALPQPGQVWRYTLSQESVQSCDPFLRHKTTRRTLYDDEYARAVRETGSDEVLFLNERGEMTEGSRTNIFIRRDEVLYTPPLDSGVLDGVLRRALMRDPRIELREKVLFPEDLKSADAVFLGNSVRGLIRALDFSSTASFPVPAATGIRESN